MGSGLIEGRNRNRLLMGKVLRTDLDPDRGALHLRLEKLVGDPAEIFDSGEGGDH